jgi:hypothetical protein
MDRTSHASLTLPDRLRIERAVWTLNGYIDDLPYRSKRARRHETRANLYAAAADVGVAEAIRGLGDLRQLAAGYLAAEYGETGPRPSYTAGLVCVILVNVAAVALVEVGESAFTAGLLAADPDISGTFHWRGIPYVSDPVAVTVTDGSSRATGGGLTVLTTFAWMAAFVLGGRLWRLLPVWRRWRSRHAPALTE